MRAEIPHFYFDVENVEDGKWALNPPVMTYADMLQRLGPERTERLLKGEPDTDPSGWRWRIQRVRMMRATAKVKT